MGAARDIQTTVRVTLAEVAKGTSKTIRIPRDGRRGSPHRRARDRARARCQRGPPQGRRGRSTTPRSRGGPADEGPGRSRTRGKPVHQRRRRRRPEVRSRGERSRDQGGASVRGRGAGGTAVAPTLDGEVEVKVRKATQPGDQLRLRGRGLPELGSPRTATCSCSFEWWCPRTCPTGRGNSSRNSPRKRTGRNSGPDPPRETRSTPESAVE